MLQQLEQLPYELTMRDREKPVKPGFSECNSKDAVYDFIYHGSWPFFRGASAYFAPW